MACELLTREFTNSNDEPVLVAVRQLSASKLLSLQSELVSKFGTRIFSFVEDKYNFADIIALMQQLSHEVFVELLKRVISMNVTVDGKEVKPALYDMQFNGEMMLSIKIFAFVCEANMLEFFKQGLAINEQRRLEVAAASTQTEQKSSPEE